MRKAIDLRGLPCPEPVLRAKRLLDDATIDSIEALVDDEVNVNNLERLARSSKLEITTQKEQDYFRVVIQINSGKQDQGITSQSEHATVTGTSYPQKLTTVLFLTKDSLGEGDKDFSLSLMNLFLQTLFDSKKRPQAILMVNSGVKLMDPQASTIKVLKDFKEQGCEVLACGLCLDYYGLKDKVAKDEITNMLTICELLGAADKVITP